MSTTRSLLLAAVLASWAAVGCGGSTSSIGLGDGGGGGGGGDGGCGPPPPLHCVGPCGGGESSAECVNGGWQCPIFAGICLDDAGGVDASPPFDAGPPGDGGITCGTKECSAATQYCNIVGGGVALPDAGSNMSWTCEALPAMPCDAGTGCACIPNACNCVDDGGAITNECFYP